MNENPKIMKINATYGRKFPAGEQYSTDYVEMSVEALIGPGNDTTYADAAAKCFADVRASVDREVAAIKTRREKPAAYVRHPDDHDEYIVIPAKDAEAMERDLGMKFGPQS